MDQAKSKLTEDLDTLRADVARLTEQLAKSAKSRFDDKLSDVGAKASEYTDAAKSQAQDLQEATVDYVTRKPLQSLAIAAGIGLILGLWSRNR